MPRRPRQHVLESISRDRFRSWLQSRGWVVRPIDSPDYGLDDLVEVFTDEEATGLTFNVQARATDQEDLDRTLRVRVRSEQQNYFAAQNDPVLLVRYHAPTDRLYAQWFHRVDPHPGSSSSTIHFDETMELTDEAIDALPREVALVRNIRAADVDWPITVHVTCVDLRQARHLAIAMSALANRNFIRVTESPDNHEPGVTVNVEEDRLAVHGGLASCTFHGATSSQDFDDLAADALLGVAVALASIGQTRAAAAIALLAAPVAPSLEEPEVLVRLAGGLARGREISAAVTIGRALIRRGRLAPARFLTPTAVIAASYDLNESEIADVSRFLVELADAEIAANDPTSAAAAAYSAGNWFFHSAQQYPSALEWYRRAGDLDDTYLDRGYYLSERAAALFECGAFLESAYWYQRAIESGSQPPKTRARRADALMFAGRYQEALAEFENYKQRPDAFEPVWLAKDAALRMVIQETGFSVQDRNPERADHVAKGAAGIEDATARLSEYNRAIAEDALCARAWHHIAVTLANDLEQPARAAGPMLMSALDQRGSDLWAEALLLAFAAGDEVLINVVAAAAAADSGATFVDAVRRKTTYLPDDVADTLLAFATEVCTESDPTEHGFTLRYRNDHGDLEEVLF